MIDPASELKALKSRHWIIQLPPKWSKLQGKVDGVHRLFKVETDKLHKHVWIEADG
jgi:hypothetical protein